MVQSRETEASPWARVFLHAYQWRGRHVLVDVCAVYKNNRAAGARQVFVTGIGLGEEGTDAVDIVEVTVIDTNTVGIVAVTAVGAVMIVEIIKAILLVYVRGDGAELLAIDAGLDLFFEFEVARLVLLILLGWEGLQAFTVDIVLRDARVFWVVSLSASAAGSATR